MAQLSQPRVAVFDVDRTLLRGDCLLLAIRRSSGPGTQVLAALRLLPWLVIWVLGLVRTCCFWGVFCGESG
jgi:glycosyltransferase 2 family protein